MTKVVITKLPPGTEESVQGFNYAVELRDTERGLVWRWTYRTWEKAEEERKRIASWFYLPTSVLPGAGVVAT